MKHLLGLDVLYLGEIEETHSCIKKLFLHNGRTSTRIYNSPAVSGDCLGAEGGTLSENAPEEATVPSGPTTRKAMHWHGSRLADAA
eukprot:IDg9738t1